MINKRSRSLPKSPAIAVDNAEHGDESGANASFPIVGLGAWRGLDCEGVCK
jgi:hypothetical protein